MRKNEKLKLLETTSRFDEVANLMNQKELSKFASCVAWFQIHNHNDYLLHEEGQFPFLFDIAIRIRKKEIYEHSPYLRESLVNYMDKTKAGPWADKRLFEIAKACYLNKPDKEICQIAIKPPDSAKPNHVGSREERPKQKEN